MAQINAEAVNATIASFNHEDPSERHYAPNSVAMSYKMIYYMMDSFRLLAIDYELASATAKIEAATAPVKAAAREMV